MALTEDQVVYIRRQVGNDPSDADLNTIYARTGDVDDLILEVLETRLAELRRNPAQFSIPGEYSQNTGENIKALEEQIAEFGGASVGGVRIIPPPDLGRR